MTGLSLGGWWLTVEDRDAHRHLMVLRLRSATFWILWVFVLTIPSTSVVLVSPAFGTVSRLVGLAALPTAAAALALGGRRARLLDVHVLMIAFTIWVVASTFWTLDVPATTGTVMTAVQLLALVLLVWEFAGDTERWRLLLVAYLAGCFVATVQMVAAVALGGGAQDGARFSVADFNPNDLSQILLSSLPVAAYLGLADRRRTVRSLAWAYLPFGVVATLLTGSRQAVVVLPLALLLVPIGLRRLSTRARVVGTAAALGCMLLVANLVPPATMARLASIGTELGDGDLGGRSQLWASAFDAVRDGPLTGTGAGALQRVIERDVGFAAGAHNSLLSVAGELGMIGLALFLLALAATAVRITRYPRTERTFALIMFLVVLATLMPGHNEYEKSTWLALAFVIAPAGALGSARTNRDRLRQEVAT